MHVKTLILGGGITGLSVAYHLEKLGQTDYLVLEKEREVGGLCRSIYKNGFTFDYAGHLLHLHTSAGKKIVHELLGKNLHRVTRRAFIYTGSSQVPFPFQAHLYALPPDVKKACLAGLLSVTHATKTPPKNFEQWCLCNFGKGIYQAFMRPYNTKLWGRAPRELTCEWCAPFVPTPSAKEIRQSACQKPTRAWGYNSFFYYPKQGGCGALIAALSAHVKYLKNTPVTQINLQQKTVRAGRKIFTYDTLVNTLPLPVFLRLLKNAPALTNLADKLTVQPVTVYQLALRGKARPFSWIYSPDEKEPFYRVGLQSSFAAANAPQGAYSLYIELPGRVRASAAKERQIYRALLQKSIISKYDEKLFSFWQTLPYAYVVYDKLRTSTVRRTLAALEKHRCFCAGRYGAWEYSFMESSLLQGQALAKKLYNEVL